MSPDHGEHPGPTDKRSEQMEIPLRHVEKTREPLHEPLPLIVPDIVHLDRLVRELPTRARLRFERIFHVSSCVGELRPPKEMHGWIEGYFGSVESVLKQRIIKVTNLVTLEGALFNELRARRPTEARTASDAVTEARSRVGDPFCRPERLTPQDVFGRVRGEHCITASNVAKYDGFHGLVIFNEHDPLAFNAEQVADYVDTAYRWGLEANRSDPEAKYFFFMWNCLWRSGASILHGHAQMALGRGMHYAKVEHLRRVALLYRVGHGVGYFDDLFAIHDALGLAVDDGGVRIMAHLTPIKEKEVLLVSGRLDDALKHSVYRVLKCFVETLGVRSFNLALCMRPIDTVPEDWRGFPIVVRVVDRGDLSNRTADFGAMELYGSTVITSDPFRVAEALAGCLGDQ